MRLQTSCANVNDIIKLHHNIRSYAILNLQGTCDLARVVIGHEHISGTRQIGTMEPNSLYQRWTDVPHEALCTLWYWWSRIAPRNGTTEWQIDLHKLGRSKEGLSFLASKQQASRPGVGPIPVSRVQRCANRLPKIRLKRPSCPSCPSSPFQEERSSDCVSISGLLPNSVCRLRDSLANSDPRRVLALQSSKGVWTHLGLKLEF